MRACDIDRSGDVWVYTPGSHKTEHHGRSGRSPSAPRPRRCSRRGWSEDRPEAYLFSPREVMAAGRRRKMIRPGEHYRVSSYRNVIRRACERLRCPSGPPTSFATTPALASAERFGLEASRTVLGHETVDTTLIYAEKDREEAKRVMREVGLACPGRVGRRSNACVECRQDRRGEQQVNERKIWSRSKRGMHPHRLEYPVSGQGVRTPRMELQYCGRGNGLYMGPEVGNGYWVAQAFTLGYNPPMLWPGQDIRFVTMATGWVRAAVAAFVDRDECRRCGGVEDGPRRIRRVAHRADVGTQASRSDRLGSGGDPSSFAFSDYAAGDQLLDQSHPHGG